ncbi:hypothetical protein [Paenibacillus alginolyticus]|uniref:DUF2281 domain-containing protein n=1 Tax=Paenibacillus alginolyticus TaxID=59839 RepID=A0ABT4GA10_9BACL|nr:hypothetical protein [Paenibacillus alginolyticus]MCY9693013.1 hypothetical protein [Paenibacillus alginolyticus]MEC0146138.1 hypothetical protein [Paenibacillus alginolyticus]
MSVNREELKRMIDHIPEQDAVEVLDFIGYLNMKREREDAQQLDIEALSEDVDLMRQVQKSREDRNSGRVYGQQAGLDYLREKVKELEHGESL